MRRAKQSSAVVREEVAEVFEALSHPTRIEILEELKKRGEVRVSSLYLLLGKPQSNTSQHLRVLKYKKLVTVRKEGTFRFYKLTRLGERCLEIANGLKQLLSY